MQEKKRGERAKFVVLEGLACGFRQGLIPKEVCESFIALGSFTHTPIMFISAKFVLES